MPPAIALEQRTTRAGATTTVATVTEVAHYLRLLFAKLGEAALPEVRRPPSRLARPTQLLADGSTRGAGSAPLLAPAVRARKGTYLDVFTAAARAGITEAIVRRRAGLDRRAAEARRRRREHTIDLVI